MKVSVALCTYNGAKHLHAQLESIASQTAVPDEIVVRDDQSTDGTIEIVQAFASQSSISVNWQVNPTRLGVSKNFEAALADCTGEIIFLSDQDDIWLPDKVADALKHFQQNPALDMIFTDATLINEELQPFSYSLWESVDFSPAEQAAFNKKNAIKSLLHHDIVTGATTAIRARHKSIYLPIPPVWMHDAWLAHIIASISKIQAISKPSILYRQHSNQQIGGIKKSQVDLARKAYGMPQETYQVREQKIATLLDRLVSKPDHLHPQVYDQVSDKHKHVIARATLPAPRGRRLFSILKEASTGRYHHYSAGMRSIIKDLTLSPTYFS